MKIKEYKLDIGLCQCPDHVGDNGNVITGYFVLIAQHGMVCYCKNCTVAIPQLSISANAEFLRMVKPYRVKGKYLRRKFGYNHFKVKSTDPLMRQLKCLRGLGYKVPLFAGDNQIAIKTDEIHSEAEIDEYFTFNVKLNYWNNIHKGVNGYEIIPA